MGLEKRFSFLGLQHFVSPEVTTQGKESRP